MKKVLMLVAIMLGTSVMVNAKPIPTKTVLAKEVNAVKHPKHAKRVAAKKARAEKKIEAAKTETPKTKK